MNGPWKESKSKLFEFPEENDAVFEVFVHHIYHSGAKIIDLECPTTHSESFLVEAYLFGDRRDCVTFRNNAIDALSELWSLETTGDESVMNLPSMRTCDTIFRQTATGSKIRQLVVDKWCWEGNWAAFEKGRIASKDVVNQDFATVVFSATMRIRTSKSKVSLSWDPDCGHPELCCPHNCYDLGSPPPESGFFVRCSEAPYKDEFCATYHDHKDGATCPKK